MHKPTVLLVEDNLLTQHVIVMLLEEYCDEILSASSGKIALQILQEVECDALIVDIGLPDEDGFQLIETIRSNYSKDLPIIGLSSHIDDTFNKKAQHLNLAAMLTKPLIETSQVNGVNIVDYIAGLG